MRIGCLVDSISREAGGLFEGTRRLTQSIGNDGDEVEVFGLKDDHAERDLREWTPLQVNLLRRRLGPLGYSGELVGELMSKRLDVLLTHGLWKYSSFASLAWHRKTGRPVIIHPHGMLDPWAVKHSRFKKRAVGLLFEHEHLRRAACIRALCESEARAIREYGLTNPICVIPNGMDLSGKVESRRSNLESEGRKTLLYLGRLHPKKNLVSLLEAWGEIRKSKLERKKEEEWVLVIAGWDQGGHERELESVKAKLEISDSVSFVGPKFGTDKEAAYQNADAFILPSLSEGLPMVVLEAWAYGKPVLMTAECNLPEGFATAAALQIGKKADEINKGLTALMEMSDDDRTAMGARGYALVADKFSWPQIGQEMRRVCQWVAEGGEVPASVRID